MPSSITSGIILPSALRSFKPINSISNCSSRFLIADNFARLPVPYSNFILLLPAILSNPLHNNYQVLIHTKYFHIYLVDYYGHGKSSFNREKYNLIDIGNDIIKFIEEVIKDNVSVLGHSSGGLIASYIASNCELCSGLILEDPPFFASVGDRRFNTYNYVDLSTVCHNFISQDEIKDFVYSYPALEAEETILMKELFGHA